MIGSLLALVTLFPAVASDRSCLDEVTALYKPRSECNLMFFINDKPSDPNWIVRVRCGGSRPTVGVIITNDLYASLTSETAKKVIGDHSNLYENEIDAVIKRDESVGPVCIDKEVVAITINE